MHGSEPAEVSSCSPMSEDGAPARLTSPRTRRMFGDGESKSMSTTTDAVVSSNSSNHLKKTEISKEMKTENSIEEIINQSETFRNKSEFDSIESVGKGAFGHVFKARDILLGMFFAIKIVLYEESRQSLREAKALSELEHRNIVRCYSVWLDDKSYPWDSTDDSCSSSESGSSSATKFLYIQMELCDTKTLEVWIQEKNEKKSLRNSKRRREGLDFVQQIVRGVEYLHSKMFIHRDLKPSNILFKGDAEVKIGDFGLVTTENHHGDESMMERTVNKGTPSYMAPEQEHEKTYNRKIDIFALGLIYFELLWKISTVHERAGVWGAVRRRTFPKNFSLYLFPEYKIIRSMLNGKPDDRPEASALVPILEECKHMLNTNEIVRRGSRTW